MQGNQASIFAELRSTYSFRKRTPVPVPEDQSAFTKIDSHEPLKIRICDWPWLAY